MLVSFGELVWDALRFGAQAIEVLGGGACASAIHAQSLGARARLVSAVGDDEAGRLALDELGRHELSSDWIQVRSGSKTARVEVQLEPEGPRYTPLQRFDWASVHFGPALASALDSADALMFALFLQGTEAPLAQLGSALANGERPRWVGCDLNLRRATSLETLAALRAVVDFVKCNELEHERARSVLGGASVAEFFLQQPSVRFVIETLGAKGARLTSRDGTREIASPKCAPAKQSLGAGDALMAALTAALCEGEEPYTALTRAVRYASEHVVANTICFASP